MDQRASTSRSPGDGIQPIPLHQHLSTPIPAPVSSLIGRQQEVAAAIELIGDPAVRLITFTGPGGVGKTRLALHVARTIQLDSSDDVAYVELAAVRDWRHVPQTIAQTIGIRLSNDRPAQQRLQEVLRDRSLLLVLDNLEHLIEAGSTLFELLSFCPHLTLLVTSRSVLNLSGEHVLQVAPLAWSRRIAPGASGLSGAGVPELPDAEQLFVERANAIDSSFSRRYGQSEVITEICARLDGLPLAIEMAAARVYLLTPQELLERLDRRLPMLTGAARDLPARQQTMHDAIAWSYDLLDPEEQAILRQLAVFVGSWTLDAAATICWGEGADEQRRDTASFSIIEALVRKSMVTRVPLVHQVISTNGPQFRLLETVREFAEVELFTANELEKARERHAAYYADAASRLEPIMWGDESGDARAIISVELGNYRSALNWALQEQHSEFALRIAGAIFDSESTRDLARLLGQDTVSQFELVQRALAMPGGSDEARSSALCKASHLADLHGNSALALLLADEAVERARACGNALRFGNAAYVRGRHAFLAGGPDDAARWLEMASTIFQDEGALGRLAWTQCMLASMECCNAPIDAGPDYPDLLRAANRCDASLATFRATGHRPGISRAMSGRAYAAYKQGNWTLAITLLRDVLVTALDEGRVMTTCVEDLADIAGRTDQPVLAARLYGSIAEERRAFKRLLPPVFRDEVDAEVSFVRNRLGDAVFASEFGKGKTMSIEMAVFEALAFAAKALAPAPVQLTSREQEALVLLAEGLTAQEMADRLFISRRTVETHLANLYAKFGVHTRLEALAAAYDQGILRND